MNLSLPTWQRLALVWGLLDDLESRGRDRVTSRDLARWLGTTPASVRKDLEHLELDQGGAAYPVSSLRAKLTPLFVLGPRRAVLVGLGNLGLALLEQQPPEWIIAAGFDSRLNRLEQLDLPFRLLPTTEITPFLLRDPAEIGILACEPSEAHRQADRLVQGGVTVLLNYSGAVLRINRHQVHVVDAGLAPLALALFRTPGSPAPPAF